MKGFPKYFNIKQDVLNALAVFPVETKAYLQMILAERFSWLPEKTETKEALVAGKNQGFVVAKQMDKGEKETIDATHRVNEIRDDTTKEVVEKYQEVYKEDPNCKLFRLGFTVAEASNLIAS